MTFSPPPLLWPHSLRPHISWQTYAMTRQLVSNAAASAAWSSANRAFYLPIQIPATLVVRRLWVAVGTTGGTNSVDMGVYDAAGNRLVSKGSGTTVGTASQVQFLDVTDTTLPPGAYYIGIAYNGTTATVMAQAPAFAGLEKISGLLMQDTAFALPATATFATVSVTFVPVCGIATTATP